MAFRKSIKCNYQPPMFSGGFGEPKMVTVESGNGINTMELQTVPVDDLCSESLPVFGLDVVKATGKPINGDVSFAPTDPADFNSVQDIIGDYLDEVRLNSPTPESNPTPEPNSTNN